MQNKQIGKASTILFGKPKKKPRGPVKQIRKAKFTAQRRIFHGNKAFEQQRKIIDAFFKMQEYIRKHEPETFEKIEK